METPLFHYLSGEVVLLGDEIRFLRWPGFVEEMFVAGTADAEAFSCSDTGGILLKEHWDGVSPGGWGRMLLRPSPDGHDWDHLEFVERRASDHA